MSHTYARLDDLVRALPGPLAGRAPATAEVGGPAVGGSPTGVLIVGGARRDRIAVALDLLHARDAARVIRSLWFPRHPTLWPFLPDLLDRMPVEPYMVAWLDDAEQAFPDRQINATRLVLTQSTYFIQRIHDRLGTVDETLLVVTADEAGLRTGAPEAFDGRGPWCRFRVLRVTSDERIEADADVAGAGSKESDSPDGLAAKLAGAFHALDPLARLDACRSLSEQWPASALGRMAFASACMEHAALDAARDALDEAERLAPDWAAVHYERGKLWLRLEDLARATEAFRSAGERMPSLSAAFSNLGAALGELDRPDEALVAFEQALRFDPRGFQTLNNVGVVQRELGRLDRSEEAFRRVIAIAPHFVFGHYNLGHTLFLAGRFTEAVRAYESGQQRDPQRNPVQASRLALSRLASGDPDGAVRDLRRALEEVPENRRVDLLAEATEILAALLSARPDLPGHENFTKTLVGYSRPPARPPG